MLYKNVASQYAYIYVHNIVDDSPETGITNEMSLFISKDGAAEAAVTNAYSEVDSTNCPGWYALALTSTETNAGVILIAGTCTIAGTEVKGQVIYTQTVMRGTDGVSLVVPDVAGTAATLHGTTDGKIDTVITAVGTDIPALVNKAIAWSSTIDTVESADTIFDLVSGPTDDDALNNMVMSIKDIDTGDIRSRRITDYVAADKRVTVDADYEFTVAAGDEVTIWANSYAQTPATVAASTIADAVWDEQLAGHLSQGSTGQNLYFDKGRY